MRDLIDLMEEDWRKWDKVRGMPHMLDNPAFRRWFAGSKCVTSDGHPMLMFHATMSNDIEEFTPEKIREVDYDAPFNGFWFSSDHETQPTWCSMDRLITIPVFLSIKNPASWEVWRKVVREVYDEHKAERETRMPAIRQGARSTHDEVRFRLQDMGYDGIVWEKAPVIDHEAFERDGRFEYRDARGHKYRIEKGQYEPTEWREVEETYYEIYVYEDSKGLEKADMANPQSVLKVILEMLDWWSREDTTKPDWSKYDMEAMEGEVTLDGKTVKVKKIPRTRKISQPFKSGKVMDTVELYSGGGHVTGYNDLEDFMDSHKHEVWVAFSPTQIKSAYNKGSWNQNNPKLTESPAPQWDVELSDADEIAEYIKDTSVSHIDYDLCRENFHGCRAVLRWVPMDEIKDTHADHHERIVSREKEYANMPLDTMPPIILDRGVIEDGHHRYRVAKQAGAAGMWAYEIQD